MAEERVLIQKCKRCGGKGLLFLDDEEPRRPFYIKCECGNKSHGYSHIDKAIDDWNEINKPRKAKPTYRCGSCKAEIHLGFETCPKCHTEIDWKG